MSIFIPADSPLDVVLLLLPDSSLMSLSSTLDTMRAANRISRRTLFRWRVATFGGEAALLTCGLTITPDCAFEEVEAGGLLIIVAAFRQEHHVDPARLKFIRQRARHFQAVGGVEAGSWVLARAGLLDEHQATTHWEDLEEFAQRFPKVRVRPDRFVIDGRYFTTGGASPSFDLMLHLIRSRYGYALALEVASVFIYDGGHSATDPQPLVSLGPIAHHEPRLASAIRNMEVTLDTPQSIAAIAQHVGISQRMLEKLFQQKLQMSPHQYYKRLRLQHARRLVLNTSLTMHEIAVRTGFNSLSVFSRAFRQYFHRSPSRYRQTSQR